MRFFLFLNSFVIFEGVTDVHGAVRLSASRRYK